MCDDVHAVQMCTCTVEPSEKGHHEANKFVPCREVVTISEVKNNTTDMGYIETSALCREVVPISEGPLSEVPSKVPLCICVFTIA